jgi:cation-transporting ATPase 13A1
MTTWTHCLVIPPSSSSGERSGIVPIKYEQLKIMASSTKDEVTTTYYHVSSINFRGWTYRCCRCYHNTNNNNTLDNMHIDYPMENIWRTRSTKSSNGNDNMDNNSTGKNENRTKQQHKGKDGNFYWEPRFHRLHFPIDLPLKFYTQQWKGHGGGGEEKGCPNNDNDDNNNQTTTTLLNAQNIYGTNITNIPLPPYLQLLQQQLLQPMFIFQSFCVLLWCLDEYWIYAVYTLCSLLLFECVQAYTRYKSVRRLREDAIGGSGGGGGGGSESSDEYNNNNDNDNGMDVVECYRNKTWITVSARQLVVGDIVSLVSSPSSSSSSTPLHRRRQQQQQRQTDQQQRGYTVPADLLLLRGRAVVNEAMLTGESVPQVKESIEAEDGGGNLDIGDGSSTSVHSRCVLFGGTVLMDHHTSVEEEEEEEETKGRGLESQHDIPTPPNGGLLCFVLRTGFDTIQGQLLRTLAYHAEAGGSGNGSGGDGVNAMDTFYFLLLLLLCALVSAGTVVRHAWGDITRNHFKLILHVIIIITSVIPPELPMELSLAVTQSLAELIKRYNIFCTEPFRIPFAGLVDTCCFDKTGTLTSDTMRLHGVRLPSTTTTTPKLIPDEDNDIGRIPLKRSNKDDDDLILFDDILTKPKSAPTAPENDAEGSFLTIRSLLPRETLRVMVGCQSLATTHVILPGGRGVTLELCGDPLEKAVMEGCGFTIHPRTGAVVNKEDLTQFMNVPASQHGRTIKVLHRFGFSSKLRRMTVIAIDGIESDTIDATLWALTKGAPEAVKPMLDPKSLPADFDQSYLRHMALGRRVLALAYRDLGKNTPTALARWKSTRDSVETKLTFAGLLIMDSPLKADSARVIKDLRAGNLNVVMVTGDAMLTAAEVARRVGIIDASQKCTYELCHVMEKDQFVFRPLDHGIGGAVNVDDDKLVYNPSNYAELEATVRNGNAFCVSGDVLTKLANHAIGGKTHEIDDNRAVLNHPAARSALARLVPLCSVFARHAPRHKEAVISAFNASGRHTIMCGDGTNDVGALKQAHVGVSIISVPDLEAKQRSADDVISAAKAVEKKERKAAKSKSIKVGGINGHTSANKPPKRRRADRVERSLQDIADAENELNYITLGNASLASPFTSRKTSIRCCKDILAQGRCTLVTMIQIYKILGVGQRLS